jgi:hypothetical protein
MEHHHDWIRTLTLDDHVVHDLTNIHDLSHLSLRPLNSGVPDNRKTSNCLHNFRLKENRSPTCGFGN